MTNLWKNAADNTDEIVQDNGEYYLKTATTSLRLFVAPTLAEMGLKIIGKLLNLPEPDDVIDNMTDEFRTAIGL